MPLIAISGQSAPLQEDRGDGQLPPWLLAQLNLDGSQPLVPVRFEPEVRQ